MWCIVIVKYYDIVFQWVNENRIYLVQNFKKGEAIENRFDWKFRKYFTDHLKICELLEIVFSPWEWELIVYDRVVVWVIGIGILFHFIILWKFNLSEWIYRTISWPTMHFRVIPSVTIILRADTLENEHFSNDVDIQLTIRWNNKTEKFNSKSKYKFSSFYFRTSNTSNAKEFHLLRYIVQSYYITANNSPWRQKKVYKVVVDDVHHVHQKYTLLSLIPDPLEK